MTIPADPPLKQAKDYRVIGTAAARLDTAAKVEGTAGYGIDFRLPNMKYAVLSRCPVCGGKVAGFDGRETKKIAGVSYVGKVGESAAAVVADNVWAAMEGRRVLNVTWDEGAHKDLSSEIGRAHV